MVNVDHRVQIGVLAIVNDLLYSCYIFGIYGVGSVILHHIPPKNGNPHGIEALRLHSVNNLLSGFHRAPAGFIIRGSIVSYGGYPFICNFFAVIGFVCFHCISETDSDSHIFGNFLCRLNFVLFIGNAA